MRILRFLRAYNTIGLAILVTGGVPFMALGIWSAVEQWFPDKRAFASKEAVVGESRVVGSEVPGPDGPLLVYSQAGSNVDAQRNVRIVNPRTGKMANLASNAQTDIFRGGNVGSLGFLGLVTQKENGRFDLVLVRFSDMTRHVLVRGVDALDHSEVLDTRTFGAVIWDGPERGRLIVVNVPEARIVTSHALDFTGANPPAIEADVPQGAPRNVFR